MMSVEAILMHSETIFVCETAKVYSVLIFIYYKSKIESH